MSVMAIIRSFCCFGLSGLLVLSLLITNGIGVSGVFAYNGVLSVKYRYAGQERSLTQLKAHDSLRQLRILTGVDLPLGGSGRPDGVGLSFRPSLCFFFLSQFFCPGQSWFRFLCTHANTPANTCLYYCSENYYLFQRGLSSLKVIHYYFIFLVAQRHCVDFVGTANGFLITVHVIVLLE